MSARTLVRLLAVSLVAVCAMPAFDASQETLAQTSFGPETFTLASRKRGAFTRTFGVAGTATPHTLTLTNGLGDGTLRAKKGTVTLNGRVILDSRVINRKVGRLTVALRPERSNEISVKLKGGVGSFVTISIEPAESTVLNFPISDADQAGLGTPFSVVVDQPGGRAYVTDRHFDSVVEFDIEQARITRSFAGVDGDSTPGNGATLDVTIDPRARAVIAINQGESLSSGAALPAGSLAVIGQDDSSMRMVTLADSGNDLHPRSIAVNPDGGVAAFAVLYGNGRQAYFIDLTTGALSTRSEGMNLNSVAANALTNEFVFTGADSGAPPSLFVYTASAPFERVRRIESSAPAGSSFQEIAINAATNTAVAVNQSAAAAFLFDLREGREIARIPITVGDVTEPAADVAINPETNMAVVTSRFTNLLTVINLSTQLVAAEIPLPEGARPLGVDIHHALNRAVVSENGLSSSRRNGSIFVVQLPTP
jgi:DNA-binding beta-propeller fold protein YncE